MTKRIRKPLTKKQLAARLAHRRELTRQATARTRLRWEMVLEELEITSKEKLMGKLTRMDADQLEALRLLLARMK